MKTYKIFNYDFKCRNFQYEIGKTYKINGNLEVCKNGFHSCENPADCFKYYNPNMSNKFAIVEVGGEIKKEGEDKIVSSEITIIRELSFNEFIKEIRINAVNNSKAVTYSNAVYGSNAVNDSVFINKCNGISNSLFCSNIPEVYLLFNSSVTKERFVEVQERLKSFNWLPKNSNIEELKERFGEYEKIPKELIKYFKLDYSTMPNEMKEYIQSLPEYDDNIFNEIKESK